MSKHYIRQGLMLLTCSIVFTAAVIASVHRNNSADRRGEIVFAATSDRNVEHISLKTGEETINFVKDDNLWRITEADSYFANYKYMEELLNFIKNSRIHRPVELNDTEKKAYFDSESITLETYAPGNKILDKIIIGQRTPNKLFAYAKLNDGDNIYLITDGIFFPEHLYSWLMQPLLSLNAAAVQDIIATQNGQKQIVGRDNPGYPFWEMDGNRLVRQASPDELLGLLANVGFIDVKSAQNFDEALYPDYREIKIVTFDGLVITLKIFKKGDEYWLKQNLSQTSLPTSAVNDYINENGFLSDYWYFKLTGYLGSRLYNTSILH